MSHNSRTATAAMLTLAAIVPATLGAAPAPTCDPAQSTIVGPDGATIEASGPLLGNEYYIAFDRKVKGFTIEATWGLPSDYDLIFNVDGQEMAENASDSLSSGTLEVGAIGKCVRGEIVLASFVGIPMQDVTITVTPH